MRDVVFTVSQRSAGTAVTNGLCNKARRPRMAYSAWPISPLGAINKEII
jgi:hypothetical protein